MVTSQLAFVGLIALTGVERLVELRLSNRNAAWSLDQGGVEHGREHYPVMVVIHTGLLLGAIAEVVLLHRPFVPWLGGSMLALALACQALRWWCITTLGSRWNTRVIVVPNLPRVTGGPYRWLNHPNYVAVVAEGIVLPMVHGAWITAAVFTAANALLLRRRIQVENAALATLGTA